MISEKTMRSRVCKYFSEHDDECLSVVELQPRVGLGVYDDTDEHGARVGRQNYEALLLILKALERAGVLNVSDNHQTPRYSLRAAPSDVVYHEGLFDQSALIEEKIKALLPTAFKEQLAAAVAAGQIASPAQVAALAPAPTVGSSSS